MGVLGRGLASLIPKRDQADAESALEHIDQMEFEQEVPKPKAAFSPKKPAAGRKLSVLEDFDDFGQVEEQADVPMPEKPLVTPLPFDVISNVQKQSIPVAEEEEVETQEEIEPEETPEEVAPAPTTPLEIELETGDDEEDVISAVEDEPDTLQEETEVEVQPEEPEEEELPQAVKTFVAARKTVKAKEEPIDVTVPSFDEGGASIWDRHEQQVEHIAIGDIKINPLQPRRTFDQQELEDLMRSIEQHGILQPLVVRRLPEGEGFELIAGERRLRASKKLGWEKVPCVVRRDVQSDQSRLVFALIENIQRENLNPVEEALAYKQLNEEYGLTHEEIGARVGKSRVAVTNIVRMLQLPAEIQRGLTEGKITTGHAKAILMIPDQDKQIRFYQHLLDEGLTVRKAEVRARRIQRTMNIQDPLRRRTSGRHPLALKYSPSLEERYGYDAQVKFLDEQNRFEVSFRAHSEAEVEELVGRLMGVRPLAHDLDKDVMED